MQEQYSAGDTIASWCTKCRLGLDHTIVAMEGEAIVKVKCRTCGSTHKFRNPSEAPKKKTRSVTAKDTAVAAGGRWELALAESSGRSQPYTMDGKYRVGDCIVHDRFGKGIVLKLYVKKCDVLVQDRERLMASGN
jgi:phage FluMu protein Com